MTAASPIPDLLARVERKTAYRGWWISYDPPPIPVRTCDWHFWHDDFDGAPDANDSRCGHAASLEEAKAQIDDAEADREADRCPTEAEKKAQGALCGCRGSDDYCPCQNVVQPLRAKIATGEGSSECKL